MEQPITLDDIVSSSNFKAIHSVQVLYHMMIINVIQIYEPSC